MAMFLAGGASGSTSQDQQSSTASGATASNIFGGINTGKQSSGGELSWLLPAVAIFGGILLLISLLRKR